MALLSRIRYVINNNEARGLVVLQALLGAFLVLPYVRSCSLGQEVVDAEFLPVYLCTDINPHACKCTRRTGNQNKVS
jgi:hypothetical protein